MGAAAAADGGLQSRVRAWTPEPSGMARRCLCLGTLALAAFSAQCAADGSEAAVAPDGTISSGVAGYPPPRFPQMPMQFTANISIIAHLVDKVRGHSAWVCTR
jgi:hypothetical protein